MKKIIKIGVIFLAILGLLNLAEVRAEEVKVEVNNAQENVIDIKEAENKNDANNTDENKTDTSKTNKSKEEVKISKTKKTLYIGEKYTLKIKGTTKKAKWWKSSNTKVATVNSNGKVTAKKKGTAEIKVKVGDKKLKCTIKVKNLPSDSKSTKGVIYLTFDDGPSATITPKVLDILKKEKVKATFFVLNYSKSNEKLIKRIVKEGHTIGIHGYSHEYSKIYKSKKAFLNNVYKLQDKIYKLTGVKTKYMRFPGGSSNTVSRHYSKGIMSLLTKEMLSRGFRYFDWNVSSGDAGGAKTSNDVYRNVTKNLSKKRGNMVLCHDFAGNTKTLNALSKIIKYAKKNGYKFKAIDKNTSMYAHGVNN